MFMKITLRCVNIRGNFIISRVEPLYCMSTIMIANCMLLRQGWHLCNSFVMSLKHCLHVWLISIVRHASKSLVHICFRGTKCEIFHEQVAYWHSILWCHAYHGYHICPCLVFLWKCHSFTLRKLYFYRETFWKCFCNLIELVSQAWRVSLFLLLFILAPRDSDVAVYAQVSWLFCVLYPDTTHSMIMDVTLVQNNTKKSFKKDTKK